MPAPPDHGHPADRAFDQAIGFIIRLQADPLDPDLLAALSAWREADPLHDVAWCEAAEIHGMSGRALDPRRGGTSRRGFMVGGLALGGAAVAGLGPGLVRMARADHRTGTGQIADFTLPQGAGLTLGPKSAVAVDDDPGLPGIRLLDGLAICTVSGSEDAPFRLRAGTLDVTARGPAVLGCSLSGGVARLTVEAGRVETPRDPGGRMLGAGDLLRDGGDGIELRRAALEAGEGIAWREQRLVVDDEAVAAVVSEIARWIPGQVILADPWLGSARVGGVFDLARPLSAVSAAVLPHGGHVREIAPYLTLVTRF
ncbi:MAG: DUF4880 domain-containing protein [Proteobacteria bacterium]|nr:DUF4880 domain-containing protein [Pseudomonadota bacterium]